MANDLGVDVDLRDNVVTSTVKLVTDDIYPLAIGSNVVRGEVLKLTAGKLSPCLTAEAPFTIALQSIDATTVESKISYMVSGSFMESEATYNDGSITEFRDALRSLNIIGER